MTEQLPPHERIITGPVDIGVHWVTIEQINGLVDELNVEAARQRAVEWHWTRDRFFLWGAIALLAACLLAETWLR